MTSAAWNLVAATIELILVESLRGLAHGEPEARSGERGLDGLDLVAVLLGLGQIADGAAEVLLLHAQKTHAGGEASVVGIGGEKRGEALLGLVEAVRVERGKGGALGGRARDAGVHLRQRVSFCLRCAGNFGVLGMGLEIIAQFRGRGGIGRIPDQRLTQAACASGSLG